MTNRHTVYLLLGPENGQKEEFIRSIKESVAKIAGGSMEEHRFYPFETEGGQIVSILQNGSLFSAWVVATLRSADSLKKGDAALLAEYCARPAENATLIITSDEVHIDKKLESAVPKSNRKVFWEMFENQKRGWITAFFKKRRISADRDAVDLLLELVENDTLDFQTVCERLAGFLGEGSILTSEEIEKFVYHSKEENVFTLFDKIAVADLAGSLEVLQKLLLSGESQPVQLLGGILWQVRRLLAVRELVARQYGIEEAFGKVNIRGKRIQGIYARGVKAYSPEDLRRIVTLIARYDAALRNTRTEMQAVLLQLFLYYAIIKRGREPEPYRT